MWRNHLHGRVFNLLAAEICLFQCIIKRIEKVTVHNRKTLHTFVVLDNIHGMPYLLYHLYCPSFFDVITRSNFQFINTLMGTFFHIYVRIGRARGAMALSEFKKMNSDLVKLEELFLVIYMNGKCTNACKITAIERRKQKWTCILLVSSTFNFVE